MLGLNTRLLFYFAMLSCLALRQVLASEALLETSPCAQVKVYSKEKIKFDETETRMLCGDPSLEPWKVIPPYQAEVFVKSFLQSRGYLRPEFKIEKGELIVQANGITEVQEILISPQDLLEAKKVEDEIFNLYVNKPLTPSILSAMEANVAGLLRQEAYACAVFKAVANGNNGVVVLRGEGLKRYKFGKVEKEKVEGLYASAFDRFYPFIPNQPFDSSKLKLTEKRLSRSGVIQGSYFLEKCDKELEEYSLAHEYILGPPRVFAFGLGISTEVGPMFRARWANNRYGPMASKLEASAKADLRNQSLKLSADNFFWKERARRSLRSAAEVSREKQVDYEETQISLSSHLAWSRDTYERYWSWSLGPTLLNGSFITDEGGDANGNFSGVALEGRLDSMAHRYELFDFLPEEGSSFRFHFDFRPPEFGFEEKLLKLEAQHTALGRLWKWGRGNAVGGIRVGAHTTIIENSSAIVDLPPSVKFYGGGSDDIRGFGYRQLPENNGVGALSKLLVKFELRKTHFYAPSLELFGFYDTAYFGFDSWELSPRLRQSPGVGLRWISPVGLFQSFIAKGSSTNPQEDEDLVVFVGLGGEF